MIKWFENIYIHLSYIGITMIVKKCNYCEKTIEGHTAKQVDYMIKQHILSKHPEKIRIV